MTILIAGTSGLIGGHLLNQLLGRPDVDRVISVARREIDVKHAKLEQRRVDFSAIGELPKADVAFCCLGTTIKKAGSKEAFRAVDHDAVESFARAAHAAGARKFLVVTALGADASSPIFYNRVKGEIERDLTKVGFDSLVVFRPSLLLGERAEVRVAEKLAILVTPLISPFLVGPLAKYRPIEAKRVASAMVTKATRRTEPFEIIEGQEIVRTANAGTPESGAASA